MNDNDSRLIIYPTSVLHLLQGNDSLQNQARANRRLQSPPQGQESAVDGVLASSHEVDSERPAIQRSQGVE
jgi:hypothetical protein